MKRVRSLAHLMKLAQQRRAVISTLPGPIINPKPAAFIIGWTGRMIHYAIQRGLYIYERKSQ